MTHAPYKAIPVVIPYFRAPEELQITIEGLKNQPPLQTEIFIRDNSNDNILFTKAINEGLRRFAFSDAHDFILVLNQGAFLHTASLLEMMIAMQKNPQAGMCAPISLSQNGSINWCGSMEAFPWGRHLSRDLKSLPPSCYETYWLNGACMLLRVAMIREIGLLDENMKFICSDADYSFSARSRGWKCLVVPTAFIEHEQSGSSNTTNPWLNKIKLEDQLYFAKKWISGDIYRSLAFEGQSLTPEFIAQALFASQNALNGHS
jgi:GT2 family glycosyltransferase